MKKQFFALFFVLISLQNLRGQNCDPVTPVFNVDLTGQPNGTWISPDIARDGKCCGVTGSDVCIQFNLTLDSLANGIRFDVVSGAMPGGALFYQINCGPAQPVGQPICLSGVGPHIITFCKPGNNTNEYGITSIPEPSLSGVQYVSQACTGRLRTEGLVTSSITWASVPNNPVYDSYLSCTSGCDSVDITPPSFSLPPYIDYKVCGTVVGGCVPFTFCDTMRVYFVNDLAVNITPANPTICYGGANATFSANGTGGVLPYSYLWNTGETTASITKGAGTYIVSVTDSRNCSVAKDTVIVIALPSPITAAAGPDGLLCTNDGSYTLNGIVNVATGGQWTGNGSFSPSSTSLNATYTPTPSEINSGLASLSLITTGNYGCPADTDDVVISLSQNPAPAISGLQSVCGNSQVSYASSYVSGHSYFWTITNGSIVLSNNNQIIVQWNNSGTGTLSLREVNSASCDSTVSINVAINSNPSVTLSGLQVVCNTSQSTYTISPAITGNSYQWNVVNGIVSGVQNNSATVSWHTSGLGNVSVTITNTNGCDTTIGKNVTVYDQPAPEISGPPSACQLSRCIYSTPYVSNHQYSWQVSGGNLISQTDNTALVEWTGQSQGSISVTQSNQLICDSTVTLYVSILMQPKPVISGPVSMCAFADAQYVVSNLNQNEIVHWSVTDGTISGSTLDDTIHVRWNNTGSGSLQLLVLNMNGCDSIIDFPITILDGPAPALTGPDHSCEQATTTYSVPKIPGHQYTWNVNGGSIVSFDVDNSIEVFWSTPGTGTVTIREASVDGCDSTITLDVRVDPKPVTTGNGVPLVCQNESNVFYAVPVNGNTYQWTVDHGIIQGNSNQPIIYCAWQDTGNYVLSLLETTQFGCTSMAQIPVRVAAKPEINITGNNGGCYLQLAQYNVHEENDVTYSYNINGGILNSNLQGDLYITWTNIGTNSINVQAINSQTGCVNQLTKIVQVDSLEKPVTDANTFNGCMPLTVSFLNNSQNSNYNYQWEFDDGTTVFNANPSHTFNHDGNYQVKVLVTNNTGCKDSAVANIVVNPVPQADFMLAGGTETVYSEIQEILLNNTSTGAQSYLWDFGNGEVSQSFEPTYQYNQPGFYTVTLTTVNQFGCIDQVAKRVEVIVPEQIFVPNAFTPNGDSKNDMFTVDYDNIKSSHISIYDRWGEVIFQSDDLNFSWNGFYKGKPVEHAVYVYSIDAIGYYGTQIRKTGMVTVIY